MDVPLFADLVLRIVDLRELEMTLVALWTLIFGGSVGSFLNVVVYRLPQGLSLIYPGSRCPGCGTSILARDNIPVVGWLKLRGRCRACRCAISPRYPLVELTTALVFLALIAAEPHFKGWNLPIPHGPAVARIYPLWSMAFYHFFLFCALFGAALMAYDDEAPPLRFWQIVWLVGLVVPCGLPLLRPVPGLPFAASWGPLVVGLLEGLAGSALGAALGVASWPASSLSARGRTGHVAGIAVGAILGAFLGWQAAAAVMFLGGLAWSAWQLARYLVRFDFDLPWSALVTATMLVWLFAWRYVVTLIPELGPEASGYLPVAAVLATLTVAWAGRTLADVSRRRRQHPSEPRA